MLYVLYQFVCVLELQYFYVDNHLFHFIFSCVLNLFSSIKLGELNAPISITVHNDIDEIYLTELCIVVFHSDGQFMVKV